MIAIVNNCERFRELAEELKERWWRPGYRDNDADIAYNTLISTYKVGMGRGLNTHDIHTRKGMLSLRGRGTQN